MISLTKLSSFHSNDLYALIDRSRESLRNLVWAAEATLNSTYDFLATKASSDDVVYGIYRDRELVGVLELRDKDANFELGYWLGSSYRGNGIMVQAVKPLVQKVSPYKPVVAHIRAGNRASMSVLTRSGLIEHHREMWRDEEWIHYSTPGAA